MVTATDPRRYRIVLAEPIAEPGLEILRRAGDVHIAHQTSAVGLAGALAEADALVVRSSTVTADLLDAAPNLRVLGRHGAGLDNIDLPAAKARGIAVVHTPGANAGSVAEFVILAAMSMGRHIAAATSRFSAGDLHDRGSLPGAVVTGGLAGSTLGGRTLGLIGLGAIGTRVAALAAAFGAEVLAHDPAVSDPPPGVRLVEGPDAVISGSDVLSLHVPLTAATAGLIGATAIAAMPPGALLINTARGGVVDDAAVLAALDAGRLGGYAVDVYDPEPPAKNHPLLRHPLVLATPHLAAMTTDALAEMARSVALGTVAALAGQRPPNLVRMDRDDC